MDQYKIVEGDGYVLLVSSGIADFEAIQKIAPHFFSDVKAHNIRKILIDARNLKGWSNREAKSLAEYFWNELRASFDVIALISNPELSEDSFRFEGLFRNYRKYIQIFKSDEYEKARDWIASR